MRKKIMIILAAAFFLAATPSRCPPQQVLMNSAETINQGNLKLAIFPTVLFGKNGGDSVWGVAGRFGYGFTKSLDIEAKVGFFKDSNTSESMSSIGSSKGAISTSRRPWADT